MVMFALVDCNNFFVSCERVLCPSLTQRPVVVASSHDGCVIARSEEAKKVGIKMGEPLFKCQHLIHTYKIVVLPACHERYLNMSAQIMEILDEWAPKIEIYSIDEAFLYFPYTNINHQEIGTEIVNIIQDQVGIPTRVGFGHTKTLAKLANYLAKQTKLSICNIHDYDLNKVLKTVPVNKLWGVGKGYHTQLKKYLILNAYHLKQANPLLIRKLMKVYGERMQLELKGVSCIPINTNAQPSKTMICSRRFGQLLTCPKEIFEAFSHNIIRLTNGLHNQQMKMKECSIFLRANSREYPHVAITIKLPVATNNPAYLMNYCRRPLYALVQDGMAYKKSGIMATELVSVRAIQDELGTDQAVAHQHKLDAIMSACHAVHNKWGRQAIGFATPRKRKPSHAITSMSYVRKATRFTIR